MATTSETAAPRSQALVDPRWAPGPIQRWAPGPIQGWEWGLLFALCAGLLAYWVPHYHPFFLPSSDFPSFEATAKELLAGQLPSSYKRMPLFPFLMGLLAPFMPGERPHLHAGLVLNMGFSLGIPVLTFLFGRRLIGPAAFLPAFGLLFISDFHRSAHQPLVDPSLTFFTLLALYLFVRESRWQYVAAGAAAICRYEASGLIAIFFVLNVVREGRPILHLVLSGLASLPFLGWMGLSILSHRAGNPYLSQMSDQEFSLAWTMIQTMLRPLYREGELDLVAIPLVLAGAAVALRRFRVPAIAILVWGFLYLGAHIAFGVDKGVYAHPVLWLPPFLMTAAVLPVVEGFARGRWRLPPPVALGAAGFALVLAAIAWWGELRRLLEERVGIFSIEAYVAFFLFLWVMVFAFGCLAAPRRRPLNLVLAALLATAFTATAGPAFRNHVGKTRKTYYAKYQYIVGTRWLAENMKEGETALVFGATAAPYFGVDPDRLLRFGRMEAQNLEELLPELHEIGATYVVYWYRRGKPTDPDGKNYARNLYYYRRYKVWLGDPFKEGKPVPGFEHLETLPLPEFMNMPPVQVYRLLEAPADAASNELAATESPS